MVRRVANETRFRELAFIVREPRTRNKKTN